MTGPRNGKALGTPKKIAKRNIVDSYSLNSSVNSGLQGSVRLGSWPEQSLDEICKPVIKCMCQIVADDYKTSEMKHVCGEDERIADDACDMTDETRCFFKWYVGSDDEIAYNLARDCMPFMFEHFDWQVPSQG
ncbi:unnamed protein product [Agarophyton chilense]